MRPNQSLPDWLRGGTLNPEGSRGETLNKSQRDSFGVDPPDGRQVRRFNGLLWMRVEVEEGVHTSNDHYGTLGFI